MRLDKMKMRELKDHLQSEGYEISERMIKYYIELGLLPVPEYPYPNQALYSHIHVIRLKRIAQYKLDGYAFSEIKQIILDEIQKKKEEAKRLNITYEEFCKMTAADLKEEADFVFSRRNRNEQTYTKEELLDTLGCDKLVFDLAVDTGAMSMKSAYDYNDLTVLLCIRNLIELDQTKDGTSNIIEKISEISKLNNIAAQLANIYLKQKERSWVYDSLLEMLISNKMDKEEKQFSSIGLVDRDF